MAGKDGPHEIEVLADSLFEAAEKALRTGAMLWWHLPDAVIEVRAGKDVWKVNPERVRDWAERNRRK